MFMKKNDIYPHDLLQYLAEALRDCPAVAPFELYRDAQTQWVISYLKKQKKDEIQLIDYACGNLRLLNAINKEVLNNVFNSVSYYGCDINPPKIEQGENLSEKIKYDFFSPESLRQNASLKGDFVVLMNVIHEISIFEFSTIIEDSRRLLKEDGQLLIVDMCLLPEGEPKAIPFFPWEIVFLFSGCHDYSCKSKSGIPLLLSVVPKASIQIFQQIKNRVYSLTEEKRDVFSTCARKLSGKNIENYYKNLIEKLSTNGDPLYNLGYLSLLSSYCNNRLQEETNRRMIWIEKSYNEITASSIAILKYFFEKWDNEQCFPNCFEIFDKLGGSYSYESLEESLELMTNKVGTFFSFLSSDNIGFSELKPMETLDAFQDFYSYDDIGSKGLGRLQEECHRRNWPGPDFY